MRIDFLRLKKTKKKCETKNEIKGKNKIRMTLARGDFAANTKNGKKPVSV